MRKKRTTICTGICLAMIFSLLLVYAHAQDVILNPGYIQGTATISGVAVDRLYLTASGCDGHDASTNINDNTYALTVNVNGGSCDYRVSCTAYSDNNKDTLHFAAADVTVSDGGTSVLDFAVTPGFISGTVSIAGKSINNGYISAYVIQNGKYTNARTSFSSDGKFSFPVQPNQDIKVSGNVYGSDGVRYNLDQVLLTVGPLETVAHDWAVQPGNGSITGSCRLNGITDYQSRQINGSGPGGTSKSTTTDTNGNYALTGLLSGSWNLGVYLRMNDWDDTLTMPYSAYISPVVVPSGGAVENHISAEPCFINGRVIVSGSKSIQSVSSGSVSGHGIYNDASYGGNASDRLNASNGSFDLILTQGSWNLTNGSLSFYENDGTYLNSSLNFHYFSNHATHGQEITLAPGDTVENHNFDIGTGTATINFAVEGGGLFSSPQVNGSCIIRDENNQPVLYTSISASAPASDVDQASVTFVGTPGTYDIVARAYVDGSLSSFGELDVVIIKGTDVIIDIGAPSVTITAPVPLACAAGSSMIVSGTASDDSGVADVLINGTPVSFVSTNNPDDENEVSFSLAIDLVTGVNIIETSVTDTQGKTATDKRTVYLDSGKPSVIWTPEQGATTTDSKITVRGTASDDGAITAVAVNGTDIVFTPTGNTDDPNAVSFSTDIDLIPGFNQIVLEVTDACGNTTDEVREIIMTEICEAVDDLAAVPKSRKVQLVWTPKGAQAYSIYRRLADTSYEQIATTNSEYSTYLDLDVTNGVTYYYTVKSICGDIEQSASNEVQATPSRRTR